MHPISSKSASQSNNPVNSRLPFLKPSSDRFTIANNELYGNLTTAITLIIPALSASNSAHYSPEIINFHNNLLGNMIKMLPYKNTIYEQFKNNIDCMLTNPQVKQQYIKLIEHFINLPEQQQKMLMLMCHSSYNHYVCNACCIQSTLNLSDLSGMKKKINRYEAISSMVIESVNKFTPSQGLVSLNIINKLYDAPRLIDYYNHFRLIQGEDPVEIDEKDLAEQLNSTKTNEEIVKYYMNKRGINLKLEIDMARDIKQIHASDIILLQYLMGNFIFNPDCNKETVLKSLVNDNVINTELKEFDKNTLQLSDGYKEQIHTADGYKLSEDQKDKFCKSTIGKMNNYFLQKLGYEVTEIVAKKNSKGRLNFYSKLQPISKQQTFA